MSSFHLFCSLETLQSSVGQLISAVRILFSSCFYIIQHFDWQKKIGCIIASQRTWKYFLIISIDYTKAFDSIRTDAVTDALSKLDMPDSITNWLIDYLDNRQHYTIFQGQRSSLAVINASVVQGSVNGPSDFIITTLNLRTTTTSFWNTLMTHTFSLARNTLAPYMLNYCTLPPGQK